MTTDDEQILEISKKKNILAPWIRPAHLSRDKTSSYLAVNHALKWYEKNFSKVDCICLLQPTSPFRSKKNVKAGLKLFKKSGNSVVSVLQKKVKNPFNKIDEKKKFFNLYFPSGSFFFISPKELNKFKNFINKKNNLFLVTDHKENIDINNIKDWMLAQRHANKKTMKNKTVFLTGAEGFIGSHMVEALVKKNFNVKALVLYNSFKDIGWLSVLDKNIIKHVDIIFGDLRDKGSFKKIINKVDYIINLAALIGIPYSYVASKNYIDVNISGAHNLLELAKNSNIERLIQTSTSEVYGTAQFIPMSEKHPINPQSPYAATKASADHLCMSYYYSFGLPITILRPFNTYGPRQSTRAVIPTIINQISKKVSKVKLGSINTTRDFNFVEDTVQAYINSLKK